MKEKMLDNRICVVGLGYIGLPAAALLADKGFRVHGVDILEDIVEKLSRGRIHIHEKQLDEMVRKGVGSGRLTASTTPAPADVFIIAVPTPINEDTTADISFVEKAVDTIVPVIEPGNMIIIESTCPVGTTELMARRIKSRRPELKVPEYSDAEEWRDCEEGLLYMCYCPERVLPGNIMFELENNSRIVGGIDKRSAAGARSFYRTIVKGDIFISDCRTAEMAKLSENTFRDVNIALANELSLIAKKLGVNIDELISLANQHPRVNILSPGCGVGGHCIPIDPWFLYHGAKSEARLIKTARKVNDGMPTYTVREIEKMCGGKKNPVVAVLGLAYKPDTNDFRESPAVEVAALLSDIEGMRVIVVEPYAERLPPALVGRKNIKVEKSFEEAVAKSDVTALLVAHACFREADPRIIAANREKIYDATGAWRKLLE